MGIGQAEFDYIDTFNVRDDALSRMTSSIGKMNNRSIEESKQKQKIWCLRMGYWLFLATNICKHKGTFISPKISVRMVMANFVYNFDKALKDKQLFYTDSVYSKSKMNIPRCILFQCDDGDNVSEDGIDFFLEEIEREIDSFKSLFLNNEDIKRIFV